MRLPKHLQIYGLLIICALALGIRLYHLGARDFWYDEAFTGIAVKESWSEMIRIIRADMHPPLYFILLKGWGSIFSYSVQSLRMFSVFGGMLGILGVFLLTRELFSRRGALYAASLTAITPFAIVYSQEARMYSWYAALVMFAAFAFVRGVKTGKTKWWALWGVAWGLALLTHYMSVLFAPFFYASHLVYRYNGSLRSSMSHKKFILGCAVALLIFLPWTPTFYKQWQGRSQSIAWIPRADAWTGIQFIEIFFIGTPPGEQGVSLPWPHRFISEFSIRIGLMLCVSLIAAKLFKKYPKEITVTLFLSALVVIEVLMLSLLGYQYAVARYILPAAYGFYILIGVYLAENKTVTRTVLVGGYILLLITRAPHAEPSGFNELSRNEKTMSRSYYVLNPFDYVVAKYYVGSDRVILYNKDNPTFNPASWTGINGRLLRTENLFLEENKNPFAVLYNIRQGSRGDLEVLMKETGLTLEVIYDNLYILGPSP